MTAAFVVRKVRLSGVVLIFCLKRSKVNALRMLLVEADVVSGGLRADVLSK